ncbi:hypothetical protein Z517_09218 [Fonsecaea pedrosoi CBS 271.37]|uniref:NDT80 domain-containing protein n=1 Tax=Fonsecaea pedrosoi CBS 271.37 TaxID=1442368 RepID=A0A0D2GWN2_9EURO|nr:uncharacterized protein Z517_09218 [Fonsecaea pedrosoi CBS 271.37]KIW76774.1 hypothetical protein Z517_09218 [Fonsecaea pedrosoi CBS 271.37]
MAVLAAPALPAHTSSLSLNGPCQPRGLHGQGQRLAPGAYDRRYMGYADPDAREGVHAIYNNMPPASSGTGGHVTAYQCVPDSALQGGFVILKEPGTLLQELSSPAIAHNGRTFDDQYGLEVPREPSGLTWEGCDPSQDGISLMRASVMGPVPNNPTLPESATEQDRNRTKGVQVALVPKESPHCLSSYINGQWSLINFTFKATVTKNFRYDEAEKCYFAYRKNFMSVDCSVVFPSYGGDEFVLWTCPETGALHRVLVFGVGVSATSDRDNRPIVLNEYTSKRQKGPIVEVKRLKSQPQPGSTKKQYGFERLRFERCTANNGTQRGAQEKFLVRASLYVKLDQGDGQESDWKCIRYNESPGVILRGCAPCHSTTKKSSSQADQATSPALTYSSSLSASDVGSPFPLAYSSSVGPTRNLLTRHGQEAHPHRFDPLLRPSIAAELAARAPCWW